MPAFELQDELNALQDIEAYEISHDRDFSVEDPEALLEGGKK
jgi:condensin complex subunit 1